MHGVQVHLETADELPFRGEMLARAEAKLAQGRVARPWTGEAPRSHPRWFWLVLGLMFLPGLVTATQRCGGASGDAAATVGLR